MCAVDDLRIHYASGEYTAAFANLLYMMNHANTQTCSELRFEDKQLGDLLTTYRLLTFECMTCGRNMLTFSVTR